MENTKTPDIIYINFLNLYSKAEPHRVIVNSSEGYIGQGVLYTLGLFIISTLFVVFWVYEFLKMDEIKTSIIVWFLDIPFNYVNFVSSNCTKFLKNHT